MEDALRERQRVAERAPLSTSDYYQFMRSRIEAENELSNMRVIWLLIAEAFFAGGYATLIGGQRAQDLLLVGQQDLLLWILPVAALAAALLGFAGVGASMKRVRQFEEHYARYELRVANDTSTRDYPPLQDEGSIRWLTNLSLIGLPLLFVLLWAIVIFKQVLSTVQSA